MNLQPRPLGKGVGWALGALGGPGGPWGAPWAPLGPLGPGPGPGPGPYFPGLGFFKNLVFYGVFGFLQRKFFGSDNPLESGRLLLSSVGKGQVHHLWSSASSLVRCIVLGDVRRCKIRSKGIVAK